MHDDSRVIPRFLTLNVRPFTEIVNPGGRGGLNSGGRKEIFLSFFFFFFLVFLRLRCLGAVQEVIFSGQMETHRSGSYKGDLDWK